MTLALIDDVRVTMIDETHAALEYLYACAHMRADDSSKKHKEQKLDGDTVSLKSAALHTAPVPSHHRCSAQSGECHTYLESGGVPTSVY